MDDSGQGTSFTVNHSTAGPTAINDDPHTLLTVSVRGFSIIGVGPALK